MVSAISTSSGFGIPKLVPRAAASITASVTIWGACPKIAGPQVPTKSTYCLPSASVMVQPDALVTKKGSPPTPRNARTGELTPPGIRRRARDHRMLELVRLSCDEDIEELSTGLIGMKKAGLESLILEALNSQLSSSIFLTDCSASTLNSSSRRISGLRSRRQR